ncbi:MAG: four helix bundle protein [Anaerolineae bacterium]|nr:four helix bundle protein [Gemmatimonadaceae bacterium]
MRRPRLLYPQSCRLTLISVWSQPSAISHLPAAIRPLSPFRFESLAIWRCAREFSKIIHDLTAPFPRSEMFGLRSQMTRAADAVSLLIAEGAGLHTNTLFNNRLSLAVAELFEVVSGAFLAHDRNYITETQHREIYQRAQQLARQINAFRRTLG